MIYNSNTWVSINVAFNRARIAYDSADLGVIALLDVLRSGRLKSLARVIKLPSTGEININVRPEERNVPSEFWAQVNLSRGLNNRIIVRSRETLSLGGSWYFFVSSIDLDQLWGDSAVNALPNIKIDHIKSKGGRKPKYNWPGAAGVAAAYIVENDYPYTQSILVRFIADWFKDNIGEKPDDREIQRFVSEMYKARPLND